MAHDLSQSTSVMESLDTLAGLADDANPVSAHLASEGAAALSVEKKLDLVIWYMREVHAHCYYTSTKLWWPWQAQRRPPAPEPPPAEPAEAEPEPPAAAKGDDAPAAEAEDSADKAKEGGADGDGSDDGEVMEEKPKDEAPKPAESRKRKQHERHKGPGKFGDRLGLGHDVHGLSLTWHDNLDRRSKKFVAAAAAFKAQTQSEEEFLAQYEEKYEAAVVEFCKDNTKEQKSEDGETQWRCLLPPNKLFRYDPPPPSRFPPRLFPSCSSLPAAAAAVATPARPGPPLSSRALGGSDGGGRCRSAEFVEKHIRNKQTDKLAEVAKRVSTSMVRTQARSPRDRCRSSCWWCGWCCCCCSSPSLSSVVS